MLNLSQKAKKQLCDVLMVGKQGLIITLNSVVFLNIVVEHLVE